MVQRVKHITETFYWVPVVQCYVQQLESLGWLNWQSLQGLSCSVRWHYHASRLTSGTWEVNYIIVTGKHVSHSSRKAKFSVFSLWLSCVILIFPVYFRNKIKHFLNMKKPLYQRNATILHILSWFQLSIKQNLKSLCFCCVFTKFSNSLCFPCQELLNFSPFFLFSLWGGNPVQNLLGLCRSIWQGSRMCVINTNSSVEA